MRLISPAPPVLAPSPTVYDTRLAARRISAWEYSRVPPSMPAAILTRGLQEYTVLEHLYSMVMPDWVDMDALDLTVEACIKAEVGKQAILSKRTGSIPLSIQRVDMDFEVEFNFEPTEKTWH